MTDTGRVVVCVTALICTTIAAMHFDSAGILWWYPVVVCGAAAAVAGIIRETVTDCHR